MATEHKDDNGRKHTFTLKDNWPGPTVSVGADVRFYLRIVVTLLLIWRIAVTISLAVMGRYDLTMYTYWSHTILVAFYVLLCLGLWIERGLLTFVALFAFVFPLGSTFLVAVAIVIIVQENATVFFATGDGGVDTLAFSMLHTGDWILHSLPLIEILLILGLGWLLYARAIIASEVAAIRTSEWKAAYVLYWLLAPLVPLLIYSLSIDIPKHYPTGIPTYVLWLGLVALDLIWMALWFFAFTSSANIGVVVYSFFTPKNATTEEPAARQIEEGRSGPAPRLDASQSDPLYMRAGYAISKRSVPRDMVVRVGALDDTSPAPPPPPPREVPPMFERNTNGLYNFPRASTVTPEGLRTLIL